MKRRLTLCLLALVAMLLAPPAFAFQAPCSGAYPSTTKPITLTTGTTSKIITGASNAAAYICTIYLQNASGTATMEYGTGTLCGTGTTALTGALGTSTLVNEVASSAEIMKVPVGNDFCIAGGSSAAGTGYVTYVTVSNLAP
jgi:hypothetical protein